MHQREFRLARIIRIQKERIGSFLALEGKIAEANRNVRHEGAPVGISRHKLKQIAESDEGLVLKLFELRALDRYLARLGSGETLADRPIFEKQSILESFAEVGRVCFILGSRLRPRERINELRRWDCRAMAILMHDLGEQRGRIKLEFEDVTLTTSGKQMQTEAWFRYLNDDGPSVVSVGSPRACLATEVLLARMFNVPEFEPPLDAKVQPPFSFIWSPDVRPKSLSAFSSDTKALCWKDKRLACRVERGTAWAIRLKDKVYEVPREYRRTKTFGVVAAQRRSRGQIYLVVAGISGPATFAASKMVREITTELPYSTDPQGHGPVLWAAISADVFSDSKREGDSRQVGKPQFVVNPTTWPQMPP
ncbi:MAG: hypothetical protein ABSD29_14290 [Verrucomicrobiota bacterium]|jgi:hypothetical protein